MSNAQINRQENRDLHGKYAPGPAAENEGGTANATMGSPAALHMLGEPSKDTHSQILAAVRSGNDAELNDALSDLPRLWAIKHARKIRSTLDLNGVITCETDGAMTEALEHNLVAARGKIAFALPGYAAPTGGNEEVISVAGCKYDAGQTNDEIGDAIRADIATAQKANYLPADLDVTVQSSTRVVDGDDENRIDISMDITSIRKRYIERDAAGYDERQIVLVEMQERLHLIRDQYLRKAYVVVGMKPWRNFIATIHIDLEYTPAQPDVPYQPTDFPAMTPPQEK